MVEGLNEQQLEKQQMPGRFKDLQTVLAVDEEAQMGHSAMAAESYSLRIVVVWRPSALVII
jgi:hypothetical protein